MTTRFDPGELEGPASPWTTTLLLSFGLHVTAFALIVGVPRLIPRPAINPVYMVDLVSLPGGPANASPPPAAAPAAARPAPAPAPKEEKAVKIPERNKKPEPLKKPEPKQTPAPKSTPERPKPNETQSAASSKSEVKSEATPQAQGTPAQGASVSGVPGGTGAAGGGYGGSGAAAGDAMTFYYSLVQRNIENSWKKPIYPPSETGQRAFTTHIRLVLTGSGRVSSVSVIAPSGYEAMDRSVLEAVHDAMFPPFPSTINSSSLTIQIEMVLTRD